MNRSRSLPSGSTPTGIGAPPKPSSARWRRSRWIVRVCAFEGRRTCWPTRVTAPAFATPPLSSNSIEQYRRSTRPAKRRSTDRSGTRVALGSRNYSSSGVARGGANRGDTTVSARKSPCQAHAAILVEERRPTPARTISNRLVRTSAVGLPAPVTASPASCKIRNTPLSPRCAPIRPDAPERVHDRVGFARAREWRVHRAGHAHGSPCRSTALPAISGSNSSIIGSTIALHRVHFEHLTYGDVAPSIHLICGPASPATSARLPNTMSAVLPRGAPRCRAPATRCRGATRSSASLGRSPTRATIRRRTHLVDGCIVDVGHVATLVANHGTRRGVYSRDARTPRAPIARSGAVTRDRATRLEGR